MLELDFTNAYCPFGCCRDSYVNLQFLADLKPKAVRALGMRLREEDFMRKMIKRERAGVTDWKLEKLEFESLPTV